MVQTWLLRPRTLEILLLFHCLQRSSSRTWLWDKLHLFPKWHCLAMRRVGTEMVLTKIWNLTKIVSVFRLYLIYFFMSFFFYPWRVSKRTPFYSESFWLPGDVTQSSEEAVFLNWHSKHHFIDIYLRKTALSIAEGQPLLQTPFLQVLLKQGQDPHTGNERGCLNEATRASSLIESSGSESYPSPFTRQPTSSRRRVPMSSQINMVKYGDWSHPRVSALTSSSTWPLPTVQIRIYHKPHSCMGTFNVCLLLIKHTPGRPQRWLPGGTPCLYSRESCKAYVWNCKIA